MKIKDEVKIRFDEKYRIGSTPWSVEVDYKSINYLVSLLKQGTDHPRLLDIGCGDGAIAIHCAKRGCLVEGLDSSPRAIRLAVGKSGSRKVRFSVADAFHVPFSKHSFDAVIDRGMVHHQPRKSWPSYRREVRRVLRPGGLLYLGVFSTHQPRRDVMPKPGVLWRWRYDRETGHWTYDHYFNDKIVRELVGPKFKLVKKFSQDRRKSGANLLLYIFRYQP